MHRPPAAELLPGEEPDAVRKQPSPGVPSRKIPELTNAGFNAGCNRAPGWAAVPLHSSWSELFPWVPGLG